MQSVPIAGEALQLRSTKSKKENRENDSPQFYFFNESKYYRRKINNWETQITDEFDSWEGNRID